MGSPGHPDPSLAAVVRDDAVDAVRAVLPRTANPEHPEEVKVSNPSDALAARNAADSTLTALLLGLGAVALLVGGVGVANTMVISVLERRNEIGLRRALGATRGQIRRQFLAESLLLSLLVGTRHACALDQQSHPWCWGDNSRNQLGQGGTQFVGMQYSAYPLEVA